MQQLVRYIEQVKQNLKIVKLLKAPRSTVYYTVRSLLISLSQGIKVNTNSYIKTILTSALQKVKKSFKDKPFTFQQDDASSHMFKKKKKTEMVPRQFFCQVSGARRFGCPHHQT